MEKTINILFLFIVFGCTQNIKKEKITETAVKKETTRTTEIPYYRFIDMLLAQVDSTEISTHKILLDTIPNKVTQDNNYLLTLNNLSIKQKHLLKKALQQPDVAKWQTNSINEKSKNILDTTKKAMAYTITLHLSNVAESKDRKTVCVLLYTLYQNENFKGIKGGGLDIIYFTKGTKNTWHIEELINIEEY